MKIKIFKEFSESNFIAKYMVAFMGVTLFLLSSIV